VAPAIAQDPAAALVARYAAPPSGGVLADLAAAPGGKTFALAGSTSPPRVTVAMDVAGDRLALLAETLGHLRAHRPDLGLVVAVRGDARAAPLRARSLDAVLLDAPCTGTGTLRRHPDARWRLGPRDIEILARLQHRLMRAAAELVAPDGILIYATCSLEREENEAQVESLMDEQREWRIEPGPAESADLDAHGRLFVLPHARGFDGAFAARLRRT
jgi:16S rRNA (cytosine967-C5)-methyltransferase